MTTMQKLFSSTAAAPAHAARATLIARTECPIESGLRRLSTSMMRATVETAGAFLAVPASLGSPWEAPRLSIPDAMHCSQMNIGEKYRLLCNLTVDKTAWDKLFPADISAQIKLDAYSELANCICGTVLADPMFTDEFGYLIPCVPCNGASRPEGAALNERGSMIVGGTWIHFTFAVQEIAQVSSDMNALPERLTAAA